MLTDARSLNLIDAAEIRSHIPSAWVWDLTDGVRHVLKWAAGKY